MTENHELLSKFIDGKVSLVELIEMAGLPRFETTSRYIENLITVEEIISKIGT